MTGKGAALLLALAVCGTATAACSGPRAFARDDQLQIVSPAPLTNVGERFAIRWTTAHRLAPAYAVFVDHNPIRPGHGMRDLADDQCKRQRGCPDDAYLVSKGVFITASNSVDVPGLNPLGGIAGAADHPTHTATVVLLDRSRHRSGDAFWTVEFRG